MKNPNALGYAAILYGLVLFFYPGGLESIQALGYLFLAPFVTALPAVLFLSYLVGGIALCFGRRWASLVVLLAAIVQVLLCIGIAAILYSLDGDHWGAILLGTSVTKSLVALVPPVPIAYLALRLRKEPGAWIRGKQTEESSDVGRRFYQHKAFYVVVAIGSALVWLGTLNPDRQISVAGMRLCYPAKYAVYADYFDSLLAQMQGSYVDVEWENMYVPDRLLADRVSGYTYDENDDFVLYGAIFTRTQFDLVAHAEGIWKIRAEKKPHQIEVDPALGGYRVYSSFGRMNDWHLVLTPPPEELKPGPDAGWYIGHCVASDRCKVYFEYENFGYVHAVQYQNLHLREEISSAIYDILEEWSLNCAAT